MGILTIVGNAFDDFDAIDCSFQSAGAHVLACAGVNTSGVAPEVSNKTLHGFQSTVLLYDASSDLRRSALAMQSGGRYPRFSQEIAIPPIGSPSIVWLLYIEVRGLVDPDLVSVMVATALIGNRQYRVAVRSTEGGK
ncbi:hypothetical protein [Pseudomonas sp. CC6-YY-74]|uniref:hypothetical protein n=1 Tax=Pseudomonas sp. CC6-YY-74 TaxID=1930532 RepID=UPI0012ABF689|nr:hypothetical protein [Pseudomonas sp. CC6-YY-74]